MCQANETGSISAELVGIGIQGPSVGFSMSATGPDTFLPSDTFRPLGGPFEIGRMTPPSSAGGGFVLYPSKPNTNMLQSVYSK